jgi:hypothetical protein
MVNANFGGQDAEQTRSALIESLRACCGSPTLASSVSFVAAAEEVLKSFVTAHVRIYLAEISPVRLAPSGSNALTDNRGDQYLVLGSEEPRSHLEFYITVLALNPVQPSDLKERSARIDPPSRFRAVRILVPASLESIGDDLLERAKFLMDAGYAWMVDSIVRMIDNDEVRVAEGLYDLCRDIFPEQILREQIWFATVGPIYGFRFITPEVLRAALKMITSQTLELPVDPIDVLAELISTRLPRELLLMDKAARVDSSMDVDIADAGYSKGASRYPFVLKSLYGSSSLTMLPMLRAANFAVLALFPAKNDIIRDRLTAHMEEFADRSIRLASRIVEAASLFEPRTDQSDEWDDHRYVTKNIGKLLGESLDEARAERSRGFSLRFKKSK